ncbi:hypothetical protein ACWGBV_04330 [Streptomyces sp. NPDC055051]
MSTDTAVDHGILFYPRGGSSLVVKNLAEQTLASGLPARIFAGSLVMRIFEIGQGRSSLRFGAV